MSKLSSDEILCFEEGTQAQEHDLMSVEDAQSFKEGDASSALKKKGYISGKDEGLIKLFLGL